VHLLVLMAAGMAAAGMAVVGMAVVGTVAVGMAAVGTMAAGTVVAGTVVGLLLVLHIIMDMDVKQYVYVIHTDDVGCNKVVTSVSVLILDDIFRLNSFRI
jgi:hypothetical protein